LLVALASLLFHLQFALSLQVVNGCNIFARASPENKLRIVRALQTGPGYEGPMDGDDPDDDGATKSGG
jgi:magnesium-transporting ATPase (P-type)